VRAFEEVAAHAVFGLDVADDGFDGRAAPQFALDSVGDATPLARDVDLEPHVGRSVVAAIAAVGDDAGQGRTYLGLDLGQDGRQSMAVVGVARHRLHMGDELAAL
jgi:hypothetical protein